MEYDLSRQRTATAKSLITVLYKEFELVTAIVSDLQSENATLQKKLETFSKSHAETEAELDKDLGGTDDYLGEKTKGYGALRVKVGKLEKELITLCNKLKATKEKIRGMKSEVALHAMDVVHLATPVKDLRLNCLRMTAENRKFGYW